MGVMISYQGQLADPGRVDELISEIKAFADHMSWRTWTVPQLVAEGHIKDTGLRGITVSVHPECGPLHFHLDSQGRFVNHSYHAYVHDAEAREMFVEMMRHTIMPASIKMPGSNLEEFLNEGVTYNWTKTQHGGPEAHIQACSLLRFVRDRFAPELQVTDSSGYFEHGNLEDLAGQIAEIDQAIHLIHRAAERMRKEGGSSDLNGLIETLQRYMEEERDMLH